MSAGAAAASSASAKAFKKGNNPDWIALILTILIALSVLGLLFFINYINDKARLYIGQ